MLVDFTRDYCLGCQVMAPDLAALRREHAGRLDVVEVNLDREKHEPLGLFFVIDAVPAQVYVDAQGRIVARHAGVASRQDLLARLRGLGWVP